MNYTKEEILNAIAIVQTLVDESLYSNDHWNSGDKDTRFSAFESVMMKHNISPSSGYEMSVEECERLWILHESEIQIEFDRLVEVGKVNEKFYLNVRDYLADQEEFIKSVK